MSPRMLLETHMRVVWLLCAPIAADAGKREYKIKYLKPATTKDVDDALDDDADDDVAEMHLGAFGPAILSYEIAYAMPLVYFYCVSCLRKTRFHSVELVVFRRIIIWYTYLWRRYPHIARTSSYVKDRERRASLIAPSA